MKGFGPGVRRRPLSRLGSPNTAKRGDNLRAGAYHRPMQAIASNIPQVPVRLAAACANERPEVRALATRIDGMSDTLNEVTVCLTQAARDYIRTRSPVHRRAFNRAQVLSERLQRAIPASLDELARMKLEASA